MTFHQKTPTTSSRAIAAEILGKILIQGLNWDRSLLPSQTSSQDKGFIQALCFGVLRHYLPLSFVLSKLTEKPLRNKDKDVEILILIALYEILFLQTPDYAALNEAQEALPKKKAWAKGFVNAVLRKFITQKSDFIGLTESSNPDRTPLLPAWILKLIETHYPKHLEAIEAAHFGLPPLHCRVNQQQISREDYLQKIAPTAPSLKFEIPDFFPDALMLKTPVTVAEIPGFLDGLISIQDLAPQKTPELLALKPGLSVLDACAAPGGKSAHILETCPEVKLLSLDIDPERLKKIHENFSRLKLNTSKQMRRTIETCNATEADIFNLTFDRILIDAPCSGLGVIRRHPEIALHRKPENFKELAEHQVQLLNALWPLLNPEGILLYATCSIATEENDGVIRQFLALHPEATVVPLDLSHPHHSGLQTSYGWQLLPTVNGPDGFYYSKLIKP